CSPWTDDLRLTLVGDERLSPALAQHNVATTHDVDALLDRLEQTDRDRRAYGRGLDARDLRLDPDLAEAWTPEVVIVDGALAPGQARRLAALTTLRPGAGLTAVARGPLDGASATFVLDDDGRATLLPDGVRIVPQTLPAAGLDPVVELVAASGSEDTHPAPWWSSADPPEPPPDNVTYLGRRRKTDERDEQERRAAVQARITEATAGTAHHPLLQLIGPVELLGANGTAPARAARQCLEYCAWLLDHPGTTAQAMAAGLLVAEGTRRSNMSRLRAWLGDDEDGEPYLPDAYSGRIRLDAAVSSDWHQLQLLVGEGVDRASTAVLELGLRLVRGAPFADAAPVQWHWAEELRTDIVSCVRDIGVELARRAVEDSDLDLARWAAARALVVAPGDELLMAARIRTEHLAGNAVETERLSLQLAGQARALGVDLEPATVDLIQEVMEGRVRARLA
ncbi:MAG TPA: peptidoglycan-binding protein LysM, partial [Friedmanniella sp.]